MHFFFYFSQTHQEKVYLNVPILYANVYMDRLNPVKTPNAFPA